MTTRKALKELKKIATRIKKEHGKLKAIGTAD